MLCLNEPEVLAHCSLAENFEGGFQGGLNLMVVCGKEKGVKVATVPQRGQTMNWANCDTSLPFCPIRSQDICQSASQIF